MRCVSLRGFSRLAAVVVFGAWCLLADRGARAADPALDSWIVAENKTAIVRLLANVSVGDGQKGCVVASPSRQHPDYYYHWTRDAALTMDVLAQRFPAEAAQRARLIDYVSFSRINQASPGQTGLGEPKYYVSGPAFSDPWGRPQNDGPALRAITLIRFAETLLQTGDAADKAYVTSVLYDGKYPTNSVIKADLEYVGHHWVQKDFDLWEEVKGFHFFTRLAQHRAMVAGARLATTLNDPGAASFYAGEAAKLQVEVEKHWDAGAGYVRATRETERNFKPSELDASVIVAALHTHSLERPLFSPADDRILSSAHKLASRFQSLYGINQNRTNRDGRAMQPGIGRYPEDTYDGYSTDKSGNPWFLLTAALAELCYHVSEDWSQADKIHVTDRNVDFIKSAIAAQGAMVMIAPGQAIDKNDDRFPKILTALIELGDGYLRRVQYHCDQTDGLMSEQFNRDNGYMQGAPNLTWSYAAFLTASARREAAVKSLPVLQPQP